MNLDFLTPEAATTDGFGRPVARSPMEHSARAAGAKFEIRAGWSVVTGYGTGPEREAAAARETAGWVDMSHLGKLEIQAPAPGLEAAGSECGVELKLGQAVRTAEAWWCRLTATRALVIADTPALATLRERLTQVTATIERASLVEVTSNFAAMTIVGPLSREVFARFSAIDLRPSRTGAGALRPGSIGRQPGILICEAEDRYLFLFGWATGEYVWSIVEDAASHLGGRPIGLDALATLPGPARAAESVSA